MRVVSTLARAPISTGIPHDSAPHRMPPSPWSVSLPPTVALAKVLSPLGARLTWAAQREHAAQIVRAVEAHKGASVFMSSAAIHNTLPQYTTAIYNTVPQYSAAVCITIGASGHRFDKTGFNGAGGVIGLGPAG